MGKEAPRQSTAGPTVQELQSQHEYWYKSGKGVHITNEVTVFVNTLYGTKVAVKAYKLASMKELSVMMAVASEEFLNARLANPYVPALLTAFERGPHYYLVFSYGGVALRRLVVKARGDLAAALKNLPLAEAAARATGSVMAACAALGLTYTDMKIDQLLAEAGFVSVCDLASAAAAGTLGGGFTWATVPPEGHATAVRPDGTVDRAKLAALAQGPWHSWGLGITFLTALLGANPFHPTDDEVATACGAGGSGGFAAASEDALTVFERLVSHKVLSLGAAAYEEDPAFAGLDPEIKAFVCGALHPDPAARATLDELLLSAYGRRVFDDDMLCGAEERRDAEAAAADTEQQKLCGEPAFALVLERSASASGTCSGASGSRRGSDSSSVSSSSGAEAKAEAEASSADAGASSPAASASAPTGLALLSAAKPAPPAEDDVCAAASREGEAAPPPEDEVVATITLVAPGRPAAPKCSMEPQAQPAPQPAPAGGRGGKRAGGARSPLERLRGALHKADKEARRAGAAAAALFGCAHRPAAAF
ncbi:MAG: hypothetical protein J3K34DRAFT_518671 [Monoraphidium minutum]|nr:MAG: hypothetical protein J3K34DRAFT_518671 [Monoraphidium minutum]